MGTMTLTGWPVSSETYWIWLSATDFIVAPDSGSRTGPNVAPSVAQISTLDQNPPHVPPSVKHGDNMKRITGGLVYDQVGIRRPEQKTLAGEIGTPVAHAGSLRELSQLVMDAAPDALRRGDAVLGNVIENFSKIAGGFRAQPELFHPRLRESASPWSRSCSKNSSPSTVSPRSI